MKWVRVDDCIYEYYIGNKKYYAVKTTYEGSNKTFKKCRIATKTEAKKALYEFKASASVVMSRVKFDLATDRYINYKSKSLARNTIINYQYIIKAMRKYFGDIYYENISYLLYEKFVDSVYQNTGSVDRTNLYITLFKDLNNYVKNKLKCKSNLNDFDLIKETTRDISNKRNNKVNEYFTFDEIKRLKEVVNSYDWLLYLVAIFGCFSIGEIRGIKVNNIKDGYITIDEQISSRGEKLPLKTAYRYRSEYLPDFLKELLETHIKVNNLKDNDYIFYSSKSSKSLGNSEIYRRFRSNLKLANIPSKKFHWFRKTLPTLLHEKGVSSLEIKNLLGHSTTATSEKYYIQNTNNIDKRLSNEIDQIMFKVVSN